MTAASSTAHIGAVPATTPTSRRSTPLVAVAFVAMVAGAAIGATAAAVVPSVTTDPAAEHAKLEAFAADLREAIRIDAYWQATHPEPR
jgi:hypothetical protein